MAFIAKRPSGNWQVRWADPDGRSRARTLPTKRAADKLKREVEDLVSRGRRWEPRDAREVPDLRVISEQYIKACEAGDGFKLCGIGLGEFTIPGHEDLLYPIAGLLVVAVDD